MTKDHTPSPKRPLRAALWAAVSSKPQAEKDSLTDPHGGDRKSRSHDETLKLAGRDHLGGSIVKPPKHILTLSDLGKIQSHLPRKCDR